MRILLPLLLIACRTEKTEVEEEVIDTGGVSVTDADGDGYDSDSDCDDNNSVVSPGAEEICDGVDNNCDGVVDEGVTTTFYEDVDGDGFGDAESSTQACEQPSGYVPIGNDCNDASAEDFPGAAERCDGIDNDCDGTIDEDVAETWYADGDGDGFGDAASVLEDCDPPSGYVDDDTDCDDTAADAFPGGTEVCDELDNDCDGTVDEGVTTTFYEDVDGDGYGVADATAESCTQPTGYAQDPGDCDDSNGAVNPAAVEVCNDIDDDCDGVIDTDAVDQSTFYADADGDGFGDADSTTDACDAPSGTTTDATDCDDADADINPDAAEVCDEADNDCDGDIDEDAANPETFYADSDGDGFGDAGSTTESCEQPSGTSTDATDCDDTDADINPDAAEVCDEADNDCDGDIDEGVQSTWYTDADGDGYGDATSTTIGCTAPSGTVADATDCDDNEEDANPGESEVCDEIDNNCDGDIDEGVQSTFYDDDDSDGYGDPDSATDACTAPSGTVADATDCDDTEEDANPGESEVCDGIDNNCDGSTDEGVTTTFYADDDGDGFGDADAPTTDCTAPSGTVADATDCDDSESAINPDATEVCDSIDNDCDGSTDEGVLTTFYADSDADGYGDETATSSACDAPTGYTDDATDCDDNNDDINPAASEQCNGEDDDCDEDIDEGVLGDGESCPAESCLEIIEDDSAATDGDYWIDFDGTATETECDMTEDGGGWTLIFSDDFESTPDSGWSISSTYSCGSWSTILGGYGNISGGEIDITVSDYGVDHTEAWVDMEYLALDSWDSETAYVEADGTSLFSQSQDNHSDSYAEVCGWDRGYNGSYDSQHDISEIFTHSASSLELIAGSTLDQSSTDESFGIDDVTIWVR